MTIELLKSKYSVIFKNGAGAGITWSFRSCYLMSGTFFFYYSCQVIDLFQQARDLRRFLEKCWALNFWNSCHLKQKNNKDWKYLNDEEDLNSSKNFLISQIWTISFKKKHIARSIYKTPSAETFYRTSCLAEILHLIPFRQITYRSFHTVNVQSQMHRL